MYESMHCFRIDARSSSYPEAEFLIANVMVLTSLAFISGIVIRLSILCTWFYIALARMDVLEQTAHWDGPMQT